MKNSIKTFIYSGLLVICTAILSTGVFAAEENDNPKPLLYQMADSTDSNGGGVIYPGTGH